MLPKKQIEEIKEELDNCKNPLYFFHDDPDGLCSFLLLYRYKREGHGIIVKRATPQIDEQFIPKVNMYNPDKIFILDLAVVEQEFIDKAKVPIIWIDHHEPLKLDKIKIFNPRINNKNDTTPVTNICYEVVKQDLWIAMCGCVGDWFMPDFFDEFKQKYPDLLRDNLKDPGDVLFTTKLGKLTKILSFVLKGKTDDAMKCAKILTRIDSPYEIINKETERGSYIYKKFEKINLEYDKLLEEALKIKTNEKLYVYSYSGSRISFTGDLANELLYHFPDKTIIVAREKYDEMKMSLRSPKKLPAIINKALEGLEGYGGGHEYACGACVKKKDFKEFLERIRKLI